MGAENASCARHDRSARNGERQAATHGMHLLWAPSRHAGPFILCTSGKPSFDRLCVFITFFRPSPGATKPPVSVLHSAEDSPIHVKTRGDGRCGGTAVLDPRRTDFCRPRVAPGLRVGPDKPPGLTQTLTHEPPVMCVALPRGTESQAHRGSPGIAATHSAGQLHVTFKPGAQFGICHPITITRTRTSAKNAP